MYASIYVPTYSSINTVNILIAAGANPFIENNTNNTSIRQLKDTQLMKLINPNLRVLHQSNYFLIESCNLLQYEMQRRIIIKTMSLIRCNTDKKYKQMNYLIATKPTDNDILKTLECPLCENLMTNPTTITSGISYCRLCDYVLKLIMRQIIIV